MKIIKKLLPTLASAGLVCSIPCTLTSCGDGWSTFVFDPINMGSYVYVTQLGGTLSSNSQVATQFYLQQANQNKKILADDIAFGYYGLGNNQTDNVMVGLTEVSIGEININESRISVRVKESLLDTNVRVFNALEIINISVSFNNIFAKQNDYVYWWEMNCNYDTIEQLRQDHNWSLIIINNEGKSFHRDWQSSDEDLEEILRIFWYYLYFPSRYLFETEPV